MRRLISLLALVAAVGGQGYPVEPDPEASRVNFLAVGRPSAIKIKGELGEGAAPPVGGRLEVKDGGLTGSARVKLEALETGIGLRDRHMKEKYLETARYPEAVLTFTSLKLPEGSGGVPFEGTLSLHGRERPVKGRAKVGRNGEKVGTLGLDFRIKLTDFGIEIPSYLGVTVAEEVDVTVESALKEVVEKSAAR